MPFFLGFAPTLYEILFTPLSSASRLIRFEMNAMRLLSLRPPTRNVRLS